MPRTAERIGSACAATLALIVLALPGAACAELPATPQDYVAGMDRDGDGRIDLDEYLAWMSRGFLRMDVDGDGRLAGDELPVPGARAVTWASHRAALAAAFARQDRDGDGFLDAGELAAPPR